MGGYALGHQPLPRPVRRRLKACAGCGLALALLLTAAASWAVTYRWVDEKGGVHYGDSIPPQYAGQGHTELSPQGRVLKRIERAPDSAEARERREQADVRREMAAREELERQRRDNALLATFNDVREIDQARQRALDQEQALLDSLLVMRKHSKSKTETDYIDQMVQQRRDAMATIRAKYDADKARYLELSGRRR